jgi:hypothetical protein
VQSCRCHEHSWVFSAVAGQQCGWPDAGHQSPHRVGEAVKIVRPGVEMSSGILEVANTSAGSLRLPKVETLFGGDAWVI